MKFVKLTYEYVKEYFTKMKCVLLSKEYIDSQTKMNYICECGNKSEIRWNNFRQGQRCQECKRLKIANAKRKYTIQHVKDFFKNSLYELISFIDINGYVELNTKIKYECKCGDLYEMAWGSLLNGNNCKKCGIEEGSKKKRIDFDFIKKFFADNRCILNEKEYKNCETPMNYICQCGNSSMISWSNFKKGKRCRECGLKLMKEKSEKRKHDFNFVKEFFTKNNCVLLEKEYISAKTKMKYICECGNESEITWDGFKSGKVRCKNCTNIKIAKSQSGNKSKKWNPSLTDEDRQLSRKTPGYQNWRKKVLRRDNYKCCVCGCEENLEAHHLNGYAEFHELRIDVNNGITVCEKCHNRFHAKYGKINIVENQFWEFLKEKNERIV